MKPLGDRTDHYWLAQRMAQLTQTDLVAAMTRAQLSQEDWAEMVENCRGCDWEAGCDRYLTAHERDALTEERAPAPCVNKDRFKRLKDALEAQG
ncbi:DUF6455 family protein [Shimia sagamensis]|uniref:DUF6455 domain-containing protein n=1 Tax=Shimia sagamensis TaxID=1566352 RepID=A0ABY1NQC3_9RHOB|nr:DUF6455 family protein [Shimia sagamensis]SMP14649.1 hypothetical protein SAMN06265373_102715 [Shimia sagamensis]